MYDTGIVKSGNAFERTLACTMRFMPRNQSRDALISQLQAELALLTRTTDHLARRSDLYADMERSWYIIARTLDTAEELSISEIATHLALDGTTITRQVTAMHRAG